MLGGRLDDPKVRLVGNQEIHLIGRDAGATEHGIARLGHGEHRGLEDFTPRHLHVVRPLADHLLADRIGRAAPGTVEQRRESAVGLDVGGEESAPGLAGTADDGRPRAVTEQDAGGTVLEIGDGRELLGADHQHRLALPRGDEAFGHGEGEDVARAGGADVEGGGVLGPDEGLEIAGSARKQAIRTGGREHDGVEIGGGDTGTPHRALTRFAAQHGDALVRAGDAALPDAGALDDPLVRGVQRPGEVGVGQHVRRHANAHARHLREWACDHERTAVSRWANSAAMC